MYNIYPLYLCSTCNEVKVLKLPGCTLINIGISKSERKTATNQMKGGPSDWLTQWKSERERDDLKRLSTSALRTNWGEQLGKELFSNLAAVDRWPPSLPSEAGIIPCSYALPCLRLAPALCTNTMSDLEKIQIFILFWLCLINATNYLEWVAHNKKNTNLKYNFFFFYCSRSKDTTLAGCHGS